MRQRHHPFALLALATGVLGGVGLVSASPANAITCTGTAWAARYFANQTLTGTAALSRCDANINFDWGQGSPGARVPVDHFSARWTRTITFAAGNYEFNLRGDDGIRLKIDGVLVLDGWKDQSATTYTVIKTVAAGNHTLTVEYYENGADASASFNYTPVWSGLAATGRWTTSSLTLPARAIHTTLLRDGRLLLVAGSGNDSQSFAAGSFTTKVWDPVTGATIDVPTPYDMFCTNHVTLADGRVLIMGGTKGFPGVNATYFQGSHSSYIFDPATNAFTKVNDTIEGHWYPTATKLGNGDVWMAGGLGDSPDPAQVIVAYRTERFSQAQQRWLGETETPQTQTFWGEYPHMFLMADGRLFYSGAHTFGTQRAGTGASIYDINAQTIGDIPGLPDKDLRDQAGSVLLPPAQNQTVMIAGGGWTEQSATPTNSTGLIDLTQANPSYVQGPSMPGPGRVYLNLTTMFDRRVLASNGSTNGNSQVGTLTPAAIYNPLTSAWTQDTPGDPVIRNYHSSTQLLPDGRVMAIGSNPSDGSFETKVSVYEPPYLFRGTRPTVSSTSTTFGYGTQVPLTVSSDAVTASLTTLGSSTHQMDSNARLIDLPIVGSGTTRTATVPSNTNLLPPGPYMLTVLNSNGVPSLAKVVTVR